MTQIIRSISPMEARFSYPMRELNSKSQSEVYEAVGDHLDQQIMEEGKKILPGAFLVRLSNQQEVAFEFGVAQSSPQNPNEIIFLQ